MSWWTSDECQIESFAMETKRGGRWSYDTKQDKLTVNGVSKFHHAVEGRFASRRQMVERRCQCRRQLVSRRRRVPRG